MWGLGLIKGMAVTMRNAFRERMTIRYPEVRPELPERARWAVAPVFHEDGRPKCTACMICVNECPDHVLHVTASTLPEGGKHIDSYTYEVGACMMCGLCVEACPYSAIEMSKEYELAVRGTDGLVRELLHDVDASPIGRAAGDADA